MNQIQPPPAFTNAEAAKLLGINEDNLRQTQRRKANQLVKGTDFEKGEGEQTWWTVAGLLKLAKLIPSAKLQVNLQDSAAVFAFLNDESLSVTPAVTESVTTTASMGVTPSVACDSQLSSPVITSVTESVTTPVTQNSVTDHVTTTSHNGCDTPSLPPITQNSVTSPCDNPLDLLEGLEISPETARRVDEALNGDAETIAWNQFQRRILPERLPRLVESKLHRIIQTPTESDRYRLSQLVEALTIEQSEAEFLNRCHSEHDSVTNGVTEDVTATNDWIDKTLSPLAELVAWRQIYRRMQAIAQQHLERILRQPTPQDTERFDSACQQFGQKLAAIAAGTAAANALRGVADVTSARAAERAITGQQSQASLPSTTHQGD